VLGTLVRQLAVVAVGVSPFMPGQAAELWTTLGGPGEVGAQRFGTSGEPDLVPGGWAVYKGAPLFPRLPLNAKAAPASTPTLPVAR